MGLTGLLARFTAEHPAFKIPPEAFQAAHRCLLDVTGTLLAGSDSPPARIITRLVTGWAGAAQATVVRSGQRVPVPEAALANGVMAHALDFDDTSWTMIAHPSAAIFPALLALGEVEQASGREVLEAFVIGLEVGTKLGRTMNPEHYRRGWHATATLGALAAAAASARLLRLDVKRTAQALSLATSHSAGLKLQFGTMAKPYHAGNAARAGALAALLAREGFEGAGEILEGPAGFVQLMSGRPTPAEGIERQLGTPFDILVPGVVQKKYPSCAATHCAIDALLTLRATHGLTAEDVVAIEVGVPRLTPGMLHYDRPVEGLQGKFSMPYCLARALVAGAVRVEHFTDAAIREPRPRPILERVRMEVAEELDSPDVAENFPARVRVQLHDGRTFAETVLKARGHPDNPLSEPERLEKFQECARGVLEAEAVRETLHLLQTVERLPRISDLLDLLR
ncbi:MAG: MmgE/PrpD family protein [Deltaproteobacteria bacterium]|nr:MmgE/PrpD family protein [Deltaproteobacteria bacterium]